MQKGLVSVVIPNYNYAQYLGEAIDSAAGQTYPNIEIIVVDDGSSDASAKILEGYKERITVIGQQNQGVAAARNNGVAASQGEFIAFLDADDAWLPAKVEKQIGCFKSTENLGLVHVGMVEIDSDGRELRERLDGGEGEVWQQLLLFSPNGILGGGSGAMIPRAIFDEVGGFDERLSTSADWDLYYRISRSRNVGFVAQPLLRYRVHTSNMHSNIGIMEHDMTLAFEKAFRAAAPDLLKIKRPTFSSLYQNLAGSYYVAGQYGRFFLNSIKSLAYDPRNITNFLKFPRRRRGK